MSKETFYFSHDYNARNDPKLQQLQMEMGQEGKGIYWDLVEMLYENDGKLEMKNTKTLAFSLRTEKDKIERVINEFELFETNGDYFTSPSVIRRLKKREEISDKRKQAAGVRWQDAKQDKSVSIDKEKQVQSKSNANAMQSDASKVKESKVKESKGKESKVDKKESKAEEDKKFTVAFIEFWIEYKEYLLRLDNNYMVKHTEKVLEANKGRIFTRYKDKRELEYNGKTFTKNEIWIAFIKSLLERIPEWSFDFTLDIEFLCQKKSHDTHWKHALKYLSGNGTNPNTDEYGLNKSDLDYDSKRESAEARAKK